MRASSTGPRRILVMSLGDVGDALLATPALARLREVYPRAHVTALTKPGTAPALAHSGLVDDFLPVDKHIFDRPTALLRPAITLGLLRFVRELRGRRFDAVVLLHHLVTPWGSLKFALLTLATGAPVRAGLDNGRGPFLTHAARDLGFDAAHESEYWLRVVGALAGPPAVAWPGLVARLRALRRLGDTSSRLPPPDHPATALPAPIFVVPDDARRAADALLRDAGIAPGEPLLAIHPGSGAYSLARRWFPDRFAAVADQLATCHGLRVVLVGGPDERALAAQVIAHMGTPAADLSGRTGLDELGGVLRRCALLVGNDSGVAHLAASVGTPVVAVFGPFNHHTWRPLGRSLVVRADPPLPCMPCANRNFSRGYPQGCPPRYCLQEVTPQMVVAAAEQLLAPR